ncbi:MAG: O-antigen ligase family protein [Actinomycetota bacterium]|nr:O-antigen ligase family protein [Actinomycetota bacterium]
MAQTSGILDLSTQRRLGVVAVHGRKSDAYRLSRSLVLVLMLVVADYSGVLDTGSSVRYLVLLPPLVAVLFGWSSVRSSLVRRTTFSDRLLLVLLGWGLAGSVLGKAFLGTETSALPIFLPMALGLLHVWAIQCPTDAEARTLLRRISLVGLVYVGIHALASSGLIAALTAGGSYRHPKAFLIALAFAGALLTRRRGRFVLLCVLAGVIFLEYPAATYVAVAVATATTLFVTRPQATPGRAYVIGVIVVAATVLGFLNLARTGALVEGYFQDVGKQSNVDTRLDLWRQGIQEVASSPLVGSSFAGEMTVPVSLDGRVFVQLALHNDYLELALGGGVAALALFLGWAIATNVMVVRQQGMLWRAGRREHATLLRVLLVAFNSWMCVALFNPLLQSVGTSAALFAIYGLMMLAAVPAPQPDTAMV